MSEPPRRRRSAPQRRDARGASILPTIALGIGVVVAGLGIGAFLSALQRNNVPQPASSTPGRVTITPVPQPTRDALALRTPVPHTTTSPTPSGAPSAAPSPTGSGSASPSASPSPTPTAIPSATAHASATARAAATMRATPRASAIARATGASPLPGPITTTVKRPAAFSEEAETTVRSYLDALITGNDAGAYAAFGSTPGDPNVRLTEEAFIDHTAHIVSVHTTHADATGATIAAEVTSAGRSYYATYHVSRGPSGAIIDGHDYIRE